jgi:hypothetical protein
VGGHVFCMQQLSSGTCVVCQCLVLLAVML